MSNTVGAMRQQSALCNADREIVLVTDDETLSQLVASLVVEKTYPDTCDEFGNWRSTFKIKVRKR